MARGKVLSSEERFFVERRRAAGASVRTIARELGRNVAGIAKAATKMKNSARVASARRAAPARGPKKRRESPVVKRRRDRILALCRLKVYRCVGGKKQTRIETVGREFPTARAIQRELARRSVNVSLSTVLRDCRARGIASLSRPKTAENTVERNNARVAAAKAMLKTDVAKFIFCDETWCNTNDNTFRKELVPPGETPTPRHFMKHARCKMMVWAAIGVGFKSELVIFPKDGKRDSVFVTGDRYIEHCLPQIRAALGAKSLRKVFVQDNARPHLKAARALKEEGRQLAEWPPYSPHLNPIEKLWSLLHRRVAERRPRTDLQLERAARAVWEEMPQQTIDQHVLSFHAWLRKCIRLGGEPW